MLRSVTVLLFLFILSFTSKGQSLTQTDCDHIDSFIWETCGWGRTHGREFPVEDSIRDCTVRYLYTCVEVQKSPGIKGFLGFKTWKTGGGLRMVKRYKGPIKAYGPFKWGAEEDTLWDVEVDSIVKVDTSYGLQKVGPWFHFWKDGTLKKITYHQDREEVFSFPLTRNLVRMR